MELGTFYFFGSKKILVGTDVWTPYFWSSSAAVSFFFFVAVRVCAKVPAGAMLVGDGVVGDNREVGAGGVALVIALVIAMPN